MRKKRIEWTEKQIKELAKLWDSKDADEIAEALGMTKQQVYYMANEIRKAGFDLPRKRIKSQLRSLIFKSLVDGPLEHTEPKND